jgi:NitT/TauT family transport system permease protein
LRGAAAEAAGDVAVLPSDLIEKERKRKRTSKAFKAQVRAWMSVLAGLIIWEIIGRYLVQNALFLATPTQAVGSIVVLVKSGELGHHAWVSGQEFLIGFTIACVGGIILGLLMASFEKVADTLNPWVSGIYATPIVAVSPLFILWLGIGIWSKVAVVISLVIFPVIINTEVGIRSTDKQLIEAVRSFGATRMQIFWKVSLPAATPFILAGIRLGVGRGLIAVVVGELFGSRAGLGFLIIQSAEVFDMPQLFAGIIVLAASGILLTAAFRALEQYLVPWHYQ